MPAVVPVPHLPFDEAQKRYWAQRPWRYDARFHVPPHHIGLVPVFIAPPRFCPANAESEDS